MEILDEILSGHVDHHKKGIHEAVFPSTIFQLRKENASHSAASLIEDCMVQLSLQGIMGKFFVHSGFDINPRPTDFVCLLLGPVGLDLPDTSLTGCPNFISIFVLYKFICL